MAEEAVRVASRADRRIALVATVRSTVGPSRRLVERASRALSENVVVRERLVDGALDVLMKEGDRAKHNRLVMDEIRRAERDADVIVLAQGSMIALLPELKDVSVPVLTSPRLGIERIKSIVDGAAFAPL